MRRFAFLPLATCPAVVVALVLALSVPPGLAAPTEKTLRDRVAQFYGLLVDGKLRQTESLVFPTDRDRYYAAEKPVIRDYKIKSIEWGADHKSAQISMVSKTVMRKARMGQFEVDFPYFSHWKFENGQWWWYYPQLSHRNTPFGDMPIQPASGAGSQLNLKEMIAKGPNLSDLQHQGVSADKDFVGLISVIGFRATIKIANHMPGPVDLKLSKIESKIYTATLSATSLRGGGVADLVVERINPGVAEQKTFFVTVAPTQQQLVFKVR